MLRNKVIYLACGRAKLKYDNVVYNDLIEDCDLKCDMLAVNLNDYDILVATPPCNFYSKARGNKPPSKYALATKHLLPTIIDKFIKTNKPFIVENVRNKNLFKSLGLYDKNCFVYTYGRHTYWTSEMINFQGIPQEFDFSMGGVKLKNYIQGGVNVNSVIDYFINCVIGRKENSE